jgi:hypothetical protein
MSIASCLLENVTPPVGSGGVGAYPPQDAGFDNIVCNTITVLHPTPPPVPLLAQGESAGATTLITVGFPSMFTNFCQTASIPSPQYNAATSVYTVAAGAGGLYRVDSSVTFNCQFANVNSINVLYILVNGVANNNYNSTSQLNGLGTFEASTLASRSIILTLNPGDTVQLAAANVYYSGPSTILLAPIRFSDCVFTVQPI